MPEPEPNVADPSPACELAGVRRRFAGFLGYGGREVLAGVDLVLARGRTLGLAGPNGSGKSTLLELLAGLDRPSAGTLRVLGGRPEETRIRRRVGYLPEDSPFPPELRVRDALRLLGSLSGLRSRELGARCDALLARVGLAGAARTRVGRCSRGMLRRFGLAQAVLHEPELLLLDEPTAGLDAQGFEVLADLLGAARARGTAVLLTSHLVGDLERHCDELAVLLDGRIVARGAPCDVLAGRTLLEIYRGGPALPGRAR